MEIKYALYEDNPEFTPIKAHPDDACYDLLARSYSRHDDLDNEVEAIIMAPGERCLARTGLFLQMEPGWEALVRPRSGNALKFGLTVLNTPGTVDAGYRNEIGVILHNAGQRSRELGRGMKIAQLAIRPIPAHTMAKTSMADFVADTARNLKGFGSSGV